jgi:hypothetical protein
MPEIQPDQPSPDETPGNSQTAEHWFSRLDKRGKFLIGFLMVGVFYMVYLLFPQYFSPSPGEFSGSLFIFNSIWLFVIFILIVAFAISNKTRPVSRGMLAAIALGFVLSIFLGMFAFATCWKWGYYPPKTW